MRRLDVILRTSVNTGVRPWTRIIDVPREELVLKCLRSLVNSINNFKDPGMEVYLTILDDHSEPGSLDKIKTIASEVQFNKVVSLEHQGYNGPNGSAVVQFEYGRDCSDLVYMVEDDYFHAPDAISRMVYAWHYFKSKTDLLGVAIYPYDSTHLYEPENNGSHLPTRLFQLDGHYWRTSNKTANTIFLHSQTIKRYWELFNELGINFPNVTEDNTINRLYNNTVTCSGPVSLFSPVPSLAVHVSYNMPMIMDKEFIDWVDYFHKLEV